MFTPRPFKLLLCTVMLIALARPGAHADQSVNTRSAMGSTPGAATLTQVMNKERRICCKTRRGHALLVPRKCRMAGGTQVGDRFCRRLISKRICCKLPINAASFRSNSECTMIGGTPADRSFCLETVCCKDSKKSGYDLQVQGTLLLGPLHYKMVPRTQCRLSSQETVVQIDMCRQVCCKIPVSGSVGYENKLLSRGDCKAQNLSVAPIMSCKASERNKIKLKR